MTAGPVLVTERLELWRPVAADRAGLEALIRPEAVRRHLGAMIPDPADVFARLLRNAGSWALYGYGTFIVREHGSREIVGNCGVFHSWRGLGADFDDKPEAGWIIAESRFGRGYAREAMAAAMAWFDHAHGPREAVCMIDPANTPSLSLAARLGFVHARNAALGDGAGVGLFRREPGANYSGIRNRTRLV